MRTRPDRAPPQAPPDRDGRRKGRLRSLEASDIPATARLFLKIFRGRTEEAGKDLCSYLHTVALGAPGYSGEAGSLVYETPEGGIGSALIVVPLQFVACGRTLRARLLCCFMMDGREQGGAAEISLALRARQQDLAFSDTASPKSLRHCCAVGGKVVPLQNWEWVRTFRPAGARLDRLASKVLTRRLPGLGALARPIDAAVRALRRRDPRPARPDLEVRDMPVPEFLDHAPALISHYAIRPSWPRDELRWLVAMAARNDRFGPFTIRSVVDRDGATVGCFVYYGERGRPARVLNVLARSGREEAVLDAMFHHLDAAGCTEAVGRAQPALMRGLSHQRDLVLRHGAFVFILTRHTDIAAAAACGDIYVGGLAGEGWSRLMSDF